MMGRKRRSSGEARIRRQRGWDGWIRRGHQGVHPRAVHAAARISDREPGQNAHDGRYDELAHLILLGKVGTELVSSFEIRVGCVNTSNPSARAMAASVIPAASAIRTASAVGAETDTITDAPSAALFCTISTDTRLVRRMIPSLASMA